MGAVEARARFALTPEAVAAATLVAQPFTLVLLALLALRPATDAEWARADPILVLAPRALTLALVPILGIVTAVTWSRIARPSRDVLRGALVHASVGAAVAVIVVGVLRLTLGPQLPSFIPPEESAGPGMFLGEMAGYAEEVIFRLGVLPLVFGALARRTAPFPAGLVSALVVGLSFAFLHAAGSPEWSWSHFVTRVVFPGMAMSLAALAISPSFVVGAHCTAHVVIPLLFV